MIEVNHKENCCGCTACASVCSHNAITMKPDVLGFLYPKVDASRCVNCCLCDKVCAFHENYDISLNISTPIAYGARHKDMNEVVSSRSGAAFVAISDYILEKGGVVYGVGYVDHFRVAHKRATTKSQCTEFKGSKYVQSDLTGVFRNVKEDLSKGYTVLFSGTPCQTAGLNAYVGSKLRENLFLADIVCHGVPSPYIWRDYINYLELKHNDKICWVNFRDKNEFGWTAHIETVKFNRNPDFKIANSLYTFLFYEHIMFRDSCASCKYTNLSRPSDVTFADFWGWKKTDANVNADDKGLSLVLCNTKKGLSLFDSIKEKMFIFPVDLDKAMQPNLEHPSIEHPLRKVFEDDYARKGFKYVIKKYGNFTLQYKVKCLMKKCRSVIRRLF